MPAICCHTSLPRWTLNPLDGKPKQTCSSVSCLGNGIFITATEKTITAITIITNTIINHYHQSPMITSVITKPIISGSSSSSTPSTFYS